MSQAAHPDLDPWHGILYAVIERLTPLFKGTERGATYARYAAGEAVAAFNPEGRADYASIGRILALSLSAITAAAHAADPDLPEAEQMRFLSKAQNLSRTADQAERTMMARRRLSPRDDIADTLIPRPPARPAHYRPLPPDDPASGAAIAARQAREEREAAATHGDKTNSTPPAASPVQNNQTNLAVPTPAGREQSPYAPPPLSDKPRPDHRANPACVPTQSGRVDQTKPTAQGPVAIPRITPESHERASPGEQTEEERTLEAFLRTALSSGGRPPDRRTLQETFGLPDQSAPLLTPGRKDRSAR